MKLRAPDGRPSLGPTIAYPATPPADSRPKPRCRFARSGGQTTDTCGELHRLLHARLRLSLIHI